MILRILGYGAFFVVSFVLCLYLTFPWSAVKQRVLTQASKATGAIITARELEPSFVTGVHAEGVSIELSGAEDPIELDRVDARASVLDFITGGYGGTIELPIAKGLVEAEISGSEEQVDIEADVREVELALIPGLKAATGLALAGAVDIDADVLLGLEAPETSEGTIDLSATGLETLKGSKAGNYPIPELVLGDLAWTLPIEKGKLIVRNQRLSGPSVELVLDGEVVLAKPLSRSLVNLSLKFKPTPAFLQKEPLLASLLKNIDRYKGTDGFYNYQVSGTVKVPRVTPVRR